MYVQHNQVRGRGLEGHNFGCNGDRGHENNNEDIRQMNHQNWRGRGRSRGKDGRSNRPKSKC